MSMPDLSIVMPAYNVAAYIDESLRSILSDTELSCEVLVIDDGSTDDTARIVQDWMQRDARIRLVQQSNKGHFAARNHALSLIQGRFLAFVDPDDYLVAGEMAPLLQKMVQDQLDVLGFNGCYLQEGVAPAPIFVGMSADQVQAGGDWLIAAIHSRRFKHYMWLYIYRVEFLREQGIRFVEERARQDIVWTTQVLSAAKRFCHIDQQIYVYRLHAQSISKVKTPAHRAMLARCYMRVVEELHQHLLANMASTALCDALRWQLANEGLGIYHEIHYLPKLWQRCVLYRELRRRKIDRLIQQHAVTGRQRWRARKRGLRAMLASWLPVPSIGQQQWQ